MTSSVNDDLEATSFRDAVWLGNLNRVRTLIKQGEDVNQRDYPGQTVLHNFDLDRTIFQHERPLDKNHIAMAPLLKEHGFDFAAADYSEQKRQVLTSAIHGPYAFNMEWIETLVACGAPITEQVMQQAKLLGTPALVGWLISHGGKP